MAATTRTSERLDRKTALVQAAYWAIAAEGFEGLRTRDVADEAGVNVATLHYYFPTKEQLIRGVVDYAMDRFRSTLEPDAASSDHLRSHLRAVRRLIKNEPQLGVVMGELALRSARDPAIARIMDEANGAWHRTLPVALATSAYQHLRCRGCARCGCAHS